jgi:hypothetical protein
MNRRSRDWMVLMVASTCVFGVASCSITSAEALRGAARLSPQAVISDTFTGWNVIHARDWTFLTAASSNSDDCIFTTRGIAFLQGKIPAARR